MNAPAWDDRHSDDWHDDRPKEECGVVGIYLPGGDAARATFFALQALQHRGQESAGMAVGTGDEVVMRKGLGLVNSVFTNLDGLQGEFSIGHTRYSTTGGNTESNAGPMYCINEVGQIAVAHNGNLTNAEELRAELETAGVDLTSTTDSEAIAFLIARNLELGIEHAVAYAMRHIKGGYAVAVVTPNSVVAFRDPNGIRPMVVGRVGDGYMVASESCAFAPVGGTVTHELLPGEMAIIDKDGLRYAQGVPASRPALCLFETIYFARPDSVMAGTVLFKARYRMGEALSREHPVDADMVIPVPDSGIPAAMGYAAASGIPYMEGMIKNRYIHRTFIQPSQQMRAEQVRMKLSPMREIIEGKRLIVVDDSIVRSTTTKSIIGLLKEYGAAEVHVRITAPPIKWPCYYGIDMQSKGQLVAATASVQEIAAMVQADSLGYLSLEACVAAVGRPLNTFCRACFDGDYPVIPETAPSKEAFEKPGRVGDFSAVNA